MWCKRSTTLDSIFIVDPPLRSHNPTSTFASLNSDNTSEDVVVNQYISFELHAGDTFSNSTVKLAGSDATIYVFGTPSSFAPVLNSPDTFVNGSISGKFTQISVINSTGNYEYPTSTSVNPSHFRKANPVPHSWPSGKTP